MPKTLAQRLISLQEAGGEPILWCTDLELLLPVLLLAVVEAEGVPASLALAEPDVSRGAVATHAPVQPDELEDEQGNNDLDATSTRDLAVSEERVQLREPVLPEHVVAREVVDLRENPPRGGEHRYAAVGKLCLPVPLDASRRAFSRPGYPRRRVVGKPSRVESNVTHHLAIKTFRIGVDRDGN